MTKKQTLLLAVAGASLLAGTQAQAAFANLDLLLNLRNITDNATGNTIATVTVDLGNVNTFVSTVSGLGGFAVLNSGTTAVSGGTYTATYTGATFSGDSVTALLGQSGANNQVGLTAVSGSTVTSELWESRQIVATTGVGGLPDQADAQATAPTMQGSGPQGLAATSIADIGNTGPGDSHSSGTTQLANSTTGKAWVSAAGNANGFQLQGQAPSNPALINFNGHIPVQGTQEPLELAQTGSVSLYSALWAVPTGSGSAPNSDLLGYFTYKPDGEVDFSTVFAAVAPVPEPATYAFFAGLGLLGLVARRQLRALAA
jgi:hypothetical protein